MSEPVVPAVVDRAPEWVKRIADEIQERGRKHASGEPLFFDRYNLECAIEAAMEAQRAIEDSLLAALGPDPRAQCLCGHTQEQHPLVNNCDSCLVPTCRCSSFHAAVRPASAPSLEPIAERIARQAHDGQKEESTGDDYIHHVERVVGMVEGDAKVVAWLHDVIEDSDVSYGELSRAGIPIAIIDAVRLLTHGGDQETRSYDTYIEDIRRAENPLALAVKVADLRDHLRPNCPERLRPRYEKALIVLGDARDPRPSEP